MTKQQICEEIALGSERYLQLFKYSPNLIYINRDIEFITAPPGNKGPFFVFRVNIDCENAEEKMDNYIAEIHNRNIPPLWILTPSSTPENIDEIMLSKGFSDVTDWKKPEYGMALFTENLVSKTPPLIPDFEYLQVKTEEELEAFMNIENTAGIGWNLLNLEEYSGWLKRNDISFYLACLNGSPVTTLAIINHGNCASIEFVSTLEKYRKHSVAYSLCVNVLNQLKQEGIELVTLRSSYEGVNLYRKLGFVPYYIQRFLKYFTEA